MNVRVCVQFEPVTEDDWQAMRSLAHCLTNNRDSVRVFTDPKKADWLVAEFTMPTEAQYQAVARIDRALRFEVLNRQDSMIGFPKTAAEAARARRKNERRKARRRAM
mgnify:CR=1 FL=1